MKLNRLRHLYEAAVKDRNPLKFYDELSEALRKREVTGADFSIRSLFENFVEGGREIVDSWNPRHGGGADLREAAADVVNSSAFSNITGQIVYNEMLQAFESEEFVFSKVIPTRATQFNGEKIPGITRIGDQSATIDEAQPYPHAGVGEDWIETPATIKRGLIVPITKEALFFDRTGLILDRAQEVGYSLGYIKEKLIVDCIIDENATAHRYKWKGTVYATYQSSSPWDNVTASNALADWTDIDNAEQTLAAIRDPHTGLPILSMPKHLVCGRGLLYTARRVVGSTTVDTAPVGYPTNAAVHRTQWPNPVSGYTILSSQMVDAELATDTHWFLGDLTKAFRYMENWPITVSQAPANSHDEFTRDIVQQFKGSQRGAPATIEPRVMTQCTA